MTSQLTSLTPTLIAGHLACVHLTQLERQRRAGELNVPFNADPRLEAMKERGQEHEAAYVARLRSERRKVCDLTGKKDASETVAAMRHGYGAIVQAPLKNASLYGIADVLLRVSTESSLGDYSYEPVDTKLASNTKAGTILQLCAYCEMLEALQGVAPESFHVVTPVGRETYRTADFAAYYRLVRANVVKAATATPPPATYPEPVAHCDICAYWRFCDERRRRDDHPSLIANIRTAQVREFERQGMTTLAAIAQAEGTLPGPPSRGSTEAYARAGHQARLQLEARGSKVVPVELLPPESARGLGRLPAPSSGDVFLDFEGDPFVGDHGLEYLTGFVAGDVTGKPSLKQYWAFDSAQEKAACEHFIDFVMQRLAADDGMHVYHFGAYEPAALKRLCARHDTRKEDLDRLLRGGRFVDLHAVVREGLRIGVERYGLKQMEPLHGYTRSLDLRLASVACRNIEIALEVGDSAGISAALRNDVAAYNSDDCYSTAALRDWLEQKRTQAITLGREIPRPAFGDTQPTDSVGARDQRIAELKTALTAGLPEQPENWSDEQRGRALLAAMLSYFRQEEKNAWWEHFRLRDLPREEQLDEREMLAGLEFVGVLPKQGKEKNARCQFALPAQETAVNVGDTVFFTKAEDPSPDDRKSTSVTVCDLDLANGSVVLSMSAAAAARYPTAVFRKQVVDAKPLENSILLFAEHVRQHGFSSSGPYAAASDLLLRRPPRGATASGGSLRRPAESNVDAFTRLCTELNGGVLPVQGPPGAGKTFAGARAIVALARAGKRIGITACSHKVIDNLLQAVRDADREESGSRSLRLVHKHDDEAPDGIEYIDNSADALAAVAPGAVVGGTVWLWASEGARERLDYLFVDEAGQMALAQALAAASATQNIVLLGDPQQLEQPTRGAHADGADVAALVHVLGKDRSTLHPEQGLFLDFTYRLHPEICAFTSATYYDDRLHSTNGLERQRIEGPLFSGAGLFLVDVPHEGNQARADEEIDAAAAVAQALLSGHTTWTDRNGEPRALSPDDVLVVAPYNAQVGALQRRLAALGVTRVGTVDKFQGQEAPVVIYSCTSSSAEDAPRGMSFLFDPHRFNVATSRAKGAVIVLANPQLFEPECRTTDQMRWANGLCRYRELAKPLRIGR